MKKLIFALLLFVPCAVWCATIGNTGDPVVDGWVYIRTRVMRIVPAQNISVSKLTGYVKYNATSGTTGMKPLIYEDDGTEAYPGDRIALGSEVVVSTTPAYIDFPFSANVNLTAGTTYWLALTDSSDGVISFTYTQALESYFFWTDNYSSPAATAPTDGSHYDWDYTLYATYDDEGGGTPEAFPQILIFQ